VKLVESNLVKEDYLYWVFPNNIDYTKKNFTLEQAEQAYLTLKDCKRCSDCIDCSFCDRCSRCNNCISLNNCNNCKNCKDGLDSFYCENCVSFYWSCDRCKNIKNPSTKLKDIVFNTLTDVKGLNQYQAEAKMKSQNESKQSKTRLKLIENNLVEESDIFWIFPNSNVYYKDSFTKEQAESAYLTLDNCENCMDCISCKNCTDCRDCENCIDCLDCSQSKNCISCKGCKFCEDCENCKNLIRSKNRKNNKK
jgi:hypothetical protein